MLSSASWQAALTRKTQQVVGADLSAFDWEKRKLVERYVREVKVIARAQKTNLRAALRNPGADASEIQKEMAERERLARPGRPGGWPDAKRCCMYRTLEKNANCATL